MDVGERGSGIRRGDQLVKVLKCNAFIFITSCPQKYAMQKAQPGTQCTLYTEKNACLSMYL